MSALGGGNTEGDPATYLKCVGKKPWEGLTVTDGECGKKLKIMNRGASGVYFPIVINSIFIPSANQPKDPIYEYLQENLFTSENEWQKCLSEDGKIFDETRLIEWVKFDRKLNSIPGFEFPKIIKYARAHYEGLQETPDDSGPDKEEQYRAYEYEALKRGISLSDEAGVEVLSLTKTHLDNYKSVVVDNFQSNVLVNKLKETRALVGFSRVRPVEGNWLDNTVQRTVHRKNKWCPAVVTYGEGIFLELNSQKLNNWARQPAVIERIKILSKRYNTMRKEKNPQIADKKITPEYVLLHTLAHILINQFVSVDGKRFSGLNLFS